MSQKKKSKYENWKIRFMKADVQINIRLKHTVRNRSRRKSQG